MTSMPPSRARRPWTGRRSGRATAGDGDRAGNVQARAVVGLGQQARGQRQHDQREDRQQAHGRAPAQYVGQDAAGHHADREAEGEECAGDAERTVARPALRGTSSSAAACHRRDRARRAEALQRPARQEQRRVPGEGRQQRGRSRARPVRKSLRRPYRSPMRPKRSRKPPDGRAKAVTAHCSADWLMPRSLPSTGSATFSTEKSSATLRTARRTARRERVCRGSTAGCRRGVDSSGEADVVAVVSIAMTRACGRRNIRGERELLLVVAPPVADRGIHT